MDENSSFRIVCFLSFHFYLYGAIAREQKYPFESKSTEYRQPENPWEGNNSASVLTEFGPPCIDARKISMPGIFSVSSGSLLKWSLSKRFGLSRSIVFSLHRGRRLRQSGRHESGMQPHVVLFRRYRAKLPPVEILL